MPMPLGSLVPAKLLCLRLQQTRFPYLVARCEAPGGDMELQIGSPVIIVEAPPTLKAATSMPTLKVNNGQVKPGDVGRVISRKPKDVWAVRLAIGTYLLDGKHIKPLDLEE